MVGVGVIFLFPSRSLTGVPLRVAGEKETPARRLEEQPPARQKDEEAVDRLGPAAEDEVAVPGRPAVNPRRSYSNLSAKSSTSTNSVWSRRSWMKPSRSKPFTVRAKSEESKESDKTKLSVISSSSSAGAMSAKSAQSRLSWRAVRNQLFMQRRSAHLEKQITKRQKSGDLRKSESFTSSTSSFRESPARLKMIIKSTPFDMVVLAVIVANLVLIGAQVQQTAVSDGEVDLGWYTHAEYVCTLLFAVELFVRMAVLRWEFFTNIDERWWNAFDAFLVFISFVDFCLNELTDAMLPGSSSFVSRLGRAIRVARVARIIRTVRFLKFLGPLRIMLSMIGGSMRSLFWILLLLVGVIYSFSIVLTQGVSDYLVSSSVTPADYAEVKFFFGSLVNTMYTLFQCISGGLSWGEVSVLMRGPGWFLEVIFVVYVFFVMTAVLNIVNGIFVDGAIELAKRDRMTIVEKQKKDDDAKQTHLVHLLMDMDTNGDGMINFCEFCESLELDHVNKYISALQLDISDAKEFFALLDSDGSGDVDIVDFVSGMTKLRGEARSVDVHMVLHQNAKLTKLVHELAELVRDLAGQEQKVGDGASRPPTPAAAPSAADPLLQQLSPPEPIAPSAAEPILI